MIKKKEYLYIWSTAQHTSQAEAEWTDLCFSL